MKTNHNKGDAIEDVDRPKSKLDELEATIRRRQSMTYSQAYWKSSSKSAKHPDTDLGERC